MNNLKLTVKAFGNIITLLLVICAVFSIGTFIMHGKDKDYIPQIGGYKFLVVLSDSMNPIFNTYDVIVDKKINASALGTGDIVTFWVGDSLVTHRIVEVTGSSGKLKFKTKGDANNVEDSTLVMEDKIIGQYIFKIPYFGLVVSALRTPIGVGIIWAAFVFLISYERLNVFEANKL